MSDDSEFYDTDEPGEPNLSQVLEAVIEAAGEQIRSCIPGVITAVNMNTGRVSVQPGSSNDPVIPDVPLMYFTTGDVRFTFPVKVGGQVLLVFGDRNLDGWIAGAGAKAVATDDPRTHDLSDALAIPLSLAPPARSADISLAMDNETGGPVGAIEIRMQPGDLTETPGDGVSPGSAKIAIGNSAVLGTAEQEGGPSKNVNGPAELVDLVVQLCDLLLKNVNLANTARTGGSTPIILTEISANVVYEIRDKLKMIKGTL